MLSADLSLLHPSTMEPNHDTVVGVTLFDKAPYRLFYINAQHVHGTDNTTCRTIQKAIGMHAPRAVVVECGLPPGLSFTQYQKEVVVDPARHTSEVAFTIRLALQRNLLLINGEPPAEMIFHNLLAASFTPQDFQAFLLIRQMTSRPQLLPSCEAMFKQTAQKLLVHHAVAHAIATADCLTFDGYVDWFRDKFPQRQSLLDIRREDVFPSADKNATFTQKLDYCIEQTREPFIVQQITDTLNEHRSVLVVYGKNHLQSQRPVLTALLGPGRFEIRAEA